MYRAQDDAYGAALALIALGEGARAGGDEPAAAQCNEEALGLLRRVGNAYWTGGLLQNLAHFRLHAGDWREAARHLVEALEIAEDYNYPMILALCVAAAGGVALAKGERKEGACLFGATKSLQGALGATFEPTDLAEYEHNMKAAREALDDAAFQAAFDEGAAWSRERSILAAKAICA